MEKSFDVGQLIFKEGDASDVAYFLKQGKVEVLKKAAHGDVQLAELPAGSVFGEMGLFEEAPRSASVRVLEPAIVDVIGAQELEQLLQQCPVQVQPIIRTVFDRLRQTSQRLTEKEQAKTIVECDFDEMVVTPFGEALDGAFDSMTVSVAQLPFRVGGHLNEESDVVRPASNNHLSLPCEGPPLLISKNHLIIEIQDDNIAYAVDRGSRHGTIVDGQAIGKGKISFKAPLEKGAHVIQFGDKHSPYSIQVECR